MNSPQEKKKLVAFIVISLASIALSLCFLNVRNFIEDELSTFGPIRMPVTDIWHWSNFKETLPLETSEMYSQEIKLLLDDVHPPGAYVLSRIFYLIFNSERWTALGPVLILYSGLLLFAFRTANYFSDRLSVLVLFLLICLMHPHVLMWGSSIRWYPYWTGLGLIALVLGLNIGQEASSENFAIPSKGKCLVIGGIITAMLYIEYVTFLYVLAFTIAWLFRYAINRKSVTRLLIILFLFLVLSSPQFGPLLGKHMGNAGTLTKSGQWISIQRTSLLVSALRLGHGILVGEAFLPWHPIVPIFVLAVVIPGFLSALRFILANIGRQLPKLLLGGNPVWLVLPVFFLVMFSLVIFSGLGGKPRGF
ncbi:MAG: hypothetical protein JXB29_01595, partial [Sedimentisphaerales bacterium]|nr:hypothetical protein [Sedimentisphaerales bacterium]